MQEVFVTLTGNAGETYRGRVIPREEVYTAVEQHSASEVARIAYREALPNMSVNHVGQAVLDLSTGRVVGSSYVQGTRGEPGYDHLISLCEFDVENNPFFSKTEGYDYGAVLNEDEARELLAGLRSGLAGGPANSNIFVGPMEVLQFLRDRGETIEDREESAFADWLASGNWPDWEELDRQLDYIYDSAEVVEQTVPEEGVEEEEAEEQVQSSPGSSSQVSGRQSLLEQRERAVEDLEYARARLRAIDEMLAEADDDDSHDSATASHDS